jgi:hypothetical protein
MKILDKINCTKSINIIFGTFVLFIIILNNSYAEVLPAFFEKDSALTVFEGKINLTAQKQAEMLMPKKSLKLKKKKEKSEAKASLKFDQNKIEDHRLAQPTDKESILKTYGDPSKPYPVAATNDAPAPFKGLMAALNAGDDELAFKYALQYAKYQDEVRQQSNRAVAFLGQAKRKEGYLPEGSWPDSEEYKQYSYLQDLDLENSKSEVKNKSNNKLDNKDIIEKANNLIEQIKNSSNDLFEDKKKVAKKNLQVWEESERSSAYSMYKGRLPVSRTGQINLYYFFNEGDNKAKLQIEELNKLAKLHNPEGSLKIAGFIANSASVSLSKSIANKYKSSFPILPGNEISKQFALKKVPVVIFVTAEGQSHIESELLNNYRIGEIVKIMQGAR